MALRIGSVVRAPWRDAGDDVNLTGAVSAFRRLGSTKTPHVVVVWNADGDVTPAGEESVIPASTYTDDPSLIVSL